jgi:hypothetical protein
MALPSNMQLSIVRHSLSAGGIGFFGAFGAHADLPAVAGVWISLTLRLAYLADKELSKQTAAKLVTAVITGLGGFLGGFKLANTYFTYSGIGTVPAIIANMGANGGLTYLYGRGLAKVFLSDEFSDSAEATAKAIIVFMLGQIGLGGGSEG